jgi:hypothetical protein
MAVLEVGSECESEVKMVINGCLRESLVVKLGII